MRKGQKENLIAKEKRLAKIRGSKRTPEQIENIRKSHLGQKAWNKGLTGEKNPLYGRKLSERQIKILRKNVKRGEQSHFWKGGVTSINEAIRKSFEYRLWRTAVFERDNYTCIWCDARSGNGKRIELHADHIKPFALFPELRFAIDNGRTLCIDCHRTTDTYGSKTRLVL